MHSACQRPRNVDIKAAARRVGSTSESLSRPVAGAHQKGQPPLGFQDQEPAAWIRAQRDRCSAVSRCHSAPERQRCERRSADPDPGKDAIFQVQKRQSVPFGRRHEANEFKMPSCAYGQVQQLRLRQHGPIL